MVPLQQVRALAVRIKQAAQQMFQGCLKVRSLISQLRKLVPEVGQVLSRTSSVVPLQQVRALAVRIKQAAQQMFQGCLKVRSLICQLRKLPEVGQVLSKTSRVVPSQQVRALAVRIKQAAQQMFQGCLKVRSLISQLRKLVPEVGQVLSRTSRVVPLQQVRALAVRIKQAAQQMFQGCLKVRSLISQLRKLPEVGQVLSKTSRVVPSQQVQALAVRIKKAAQQVFHGHFFKKCHNLVIRNFSKL